MQNASTPYCPDCGPVTVSHWVERWTASLNIVFGYLTRPSAEIWYWIRPTIMKLRPELLVPPLARLGAALGLGQLLDAPDEKNVDRARVIWEEAKKRGIKMYEFRPFGLAREVFFATWHGDTRSFDGLPRPRLAHETSLAWMDDKGTILKKFREHGVPVPRGGSVRTEAQAEKIFASINGPVIVKPAVGSRSRHTYIHITDIESLRKAFRKAKELSPYVVVEEELEGFVFRLTFVGGKVAGVMRREPPNVIGDGNHTIQELVAIENKNPLRHGPIFHELSLENDDAKKILREQNLSESSVPENGRMVMLHPKVSRSYGASTTEITNIYPENIKMFARIVETLDDPLVGVDFMINDMAQPWRNQKCGVIECNSLPFIDLHHYPLKGPARNIAADVWNLIFPDSKSNL